MLYYLVLVLLVIVSVCLVGVVLLQSGKGNNLTNAFEGEATFGNRSGDVLTKSTMVLAVSFLVLCLLATVLYKQANASIFSGTVVNRTAARQENMKSLSQQEAEAEALAKEEAEARAQEAAEKAAAATNNSAAVSEIVKAATNVIVEASPKAGE